MCMKRCWKHLGGGKPFPKSMQSAVRVWIVCALILGAALLACDQKGSTDPEAGPDDERLLWSYSDEKTFGQPAIGMAVTDRVIVFAGDGVHAYRR